jgi:antirestriction protein ArdC
MSNYPAIFTGFMAKGIPEADIRPRDNVFTYEAWRALGRQVRKGEHGVKVCTFIECGKVEVDDKTGKETQPYRRPWTTTVFHLSQTEPATVREVAA